MQVRTPAAAGMFYPADAGQLVHTIQDCMTHRHGPGGAPASDGVAGIICPHAGYMYSGPVACHSLRSISSGSYDLFIIIGPNHWGLGCGIATMDDCTWQTPLGTVEVDSESARLLENSSQAELDFFAHTKEHSLEVQIPMLQHAFPHGFKILPVVMADQSREAAVALGGAIAGIARERNAMIIGSSDLTHYESNDFAHEQDAALMDPITQMDTDGFYDVLEDRQVTACGYGAIAAAMTACAELGASEGRVLKYATSGDVSGEKTSVVGYGSIAFS